MSDNTRPPEPWVVEPRRRYECPKHGEHDATFEFALDELGVRKIDRVYCLHCLFEHLDKIGVEQMKPVQ